MKILFDSQIFTAQQYGGISRYITSLAQNLSLLPSLKPYIVAPLHVNEYLESLPHDILYGRCKKVKSWAKMYAQAVGLLASNLAAAKIQPDILHRTYYYPNIKAKKGIKSVITVYDMIHEKFEKDNSIFQSSVRFKASAISQADHVICISKNTRRDLLNMYDMPESKVSVVYLGYDELIGRCNLEDSKSSQHDMGQPYILYVGKRSGYKNFKNFIVAFGSSAWLRKNFHVLCFGGGDFSYEERLLINQCGAMGRIRQVSGSDDQLAAAYVGATLFIYPSLYEGFGIPPLESMSLGCPVACSNTSSIPEVVGNAAITFDPVDIEAIRIAMESILNSSAVRASSIQAGHQRAQIFSWKRCAIETEGVYRKILEYGL